MRITILLALLLSSLGLAATGEIPRGMPTKLGVGLFEGDAKTWMKSSGVPWQIRYRYLTYRWSNNWGYEPKDGSFAGRTFRESDSMGYLPAISYYEIYDIPPTGVGQLAKMQNPTAMLEYFNDFKLLMQQAKAFGKPVLIMVEPDATGFLQAESNSNPNTMAAVASTGMPELSTLPNTAAGWGLAFLQLRKAVGANNVILGLHVSGWASGQDLFHSSPTAALQPAVDKVANFLGPLGLVNNITGQTYDLLVMDPLDRDADYYRILRGEDRWWDQSNTASLTSKSFNRYAEWLRLWNVKTGKRIVLWQIPVGNASSTNVCAKGLLNQGYKDNRSEYFFGPLGAGHRKLFVDNGVIALLFGAGEGCQSTHVIDNNYLKNSAGTFFANGGLVLPNSGTVVDAGTIAVPDAGTPVKDAGFVCPVCPVCPVVDAGQPTPAPVTDAGPVVGYEFDNTVQGFTSNSSNVTLSVSNSTLALAMTNANGTISISTPNPVIPRGVIVGYRIFVPLQAPVSSLQVFAQETSATSWKWNANWYPSSTFKLGEWNTLTLQLPAVPGVLQTLGIEITLNAPYSGIFYIDWIRWSGSEAPVPDAGVAVPDAGTPVVVPIGATLRVMPLGDSITAEEWAWRCRLSQLITEGGRNAVFVGSVHNQYDPCAADHEGHPGFTISNLSDKVDGWLTTFRPNVVVIMAGTNDLAWWTAENGTQVADRMNSLISKIQTTAPGVRIVVQTIPPQSSAIIAPNNVNRQVLVQQYNDRLKALIAARVTSGQLIRLADTNAALTLTDLRDGIHPTTQAGIAKVAPTVYNTLVPLLP